MLCDPTSDLTAGQTDPTRGRAAEYRRQRAGQHLGKLASTTGQGESSPVDRFRNQQEGAVRELDSRETGRCGGKGGNAGPIPRRYILTPRVRTIKKIPTGSFRPSPGSFAPIRSAGEKVPEGRLWGLVTHYVRASISTCAVFGAASAVTCGGQPISHVADRGQTNGT
jgi:hypothetical protein